jgi:hypothetical protein
LVRAGAGAGVFDGSALSVRVVLSAAPVVASVAAVVSGGASFSGMPKPYPRPKTGNRKVTEKWCY